MNKFATLSTKKSATQFRSKNVPLSMNKSATLCRKLSMNKSATL